MLANASYWTHYYNRKEPERGGWFYLTARDWREATGLTDSEQVSARKLLNASGVWEEKWLGSPGRWHYRVNMDGIFKLLSGLDQAPPDDPSVRVSALLGPSVLFFKSLVDVQGTVSGGLVLGHLVGLANRAEANRTLEPDGYFQNVAATKALGLTEKVERSAREHLRAAGFLTQRWGLGQPPKLFIRLNLEVLYGCLLAQVRPQRRAKRTQRVRASGLELAPAQQSLLSVPSVEAPSRVPGATLINRLLAPGTAVRPLPQPTPIWRTSSLLAHQPEEAQTARIKPQRLIPHSLPEDSRSALFQHRPNPQRLLPGSRPAFSGTPYIQNYFTETTTTGSGQSSSGDEQDALKASSAGGVAVREPRERDARRVRPPQMAAAPSARLPEDLDSRVKTELDKLIMPRLLDSTLHEKACAILVAHAKPALWQPLLDELAGRLRTAKVQSPLGWFFRVVKSAAKPDFVFLHADTVVREREAQVAHDMRVAAATGPQVQPLLSNGPQAESSSDPLSEEAIAAREQIAQVRAAVLGKGLNSRVKVDS